MTPSRQAPPTSTNNLRQPIVAGTGALLLVAALVVGGGRFGVERDLFLTLGRAGESMGAPLLIFTKLGNIPVLTPIAICIALALVRWCGWRIGLGYAAGVLAGRVLVEMVKIGVQRPRPMLLPHLDAVGGWSFPSAHAAMTTIAYVGGALLSRDRWLIGFALLIAGLVGLSRIMLAVHWPSDVIGGWCLGGLWALGMAQLILRAAR